jgi:hypothetical protein
MGARRRIPRWTLGALVVLAVVAGGSWWALRATTSAPTAAADAFLDALIDGRTAAAYARLCPADREARTLDEFAHAVSELTRGVVAHEAATLDPVGDTRTVHYTLDYGDRTDEFDLDVDRAADGTWQVCRFFA